MPEYVLDQNRSRIGFVAAHRIGSRVRGRFDTFEGALDPAAGWVTVQLDSVNTGNTRRDDQLRKDFFGTATYPEMTFVTTEITPQGTDRYDVTGELTLRGTTHPLTVPFVLTQTADEAHLTATAKLNRHTWQANWNTFTTALVHPEVLIDLDVTATRY
ncbi:YceI family protein [Kribbella sp. GL6]|uniref:YceI family protein n=1 Tax=Kribbella sp. GL6 TaxID=3419765 RepID=UPI003D07EC49